MCCEVFRRFDQKLPGHPSVPLKFVFVEIAPNLPFVEQQARGDSLPSSCDDTDSSDDDYIDTVDTMQVDITFYDANHCPGVCVVFIKVSTSIATTTTTKTTHSSEKRESAAASDTTSIASDTTTTSTSTKTTHSSEKRESAAASDTISIASDTTTTSLQQPTIGAIVAIARRSMYRKLS